MDLKDFHYHSKIKNKGGNDPFFIAILESRKLSKLLDNEEVEKIDLARDQRIEQAGCAGLRL